MARVRRWRSASFQSLGGTTEVTQDLLGAAAATGDTIQRVVGNIHTSRTTGDALTKRLFLGLVRGTSAASPLGPGANEEDWMWWGARWFTREIGTGTQTISHFIDVDVQGQRALGSSETLWFRSAASPTAASGWIVAGSFRVLLLGPDT